MKIAYSGHIVVGTLHVWNEFGTNCIAKVLGACVMWLPYWRVHFDSNSNTNGGRVSLVVDLFSGAIQSSTSSFYGVPLPFDQNSVAFNEGQDAANLAFSIAVATYLGVIFAGGLSEPAAAPASIAALWGVSFAAGIPAFLVYQDKTSRENFLAGELAAIGLGVLGNFLNLMNLPTGPCNWPCIPLIDWGWTAYWGIVAASSPWGRVVLLTGLFGLILAILEIALMVETVS